MSTMTDTLKNEEALFIPGEETQPKEEYIPKVAGEYLGHITDARTITREFKRDGHTFKARIFNFKIHVAKENTQQTYKLHNSDGTMREVDGHHYVGWTVVADGVFRFLEPKDGDSFISNAEGNKRYLMFCQSLGMEIETSERTVNGKTVKVQILPDLDVNTLNGTPVVAVVGRGQDWVNDAGETRPSWRCKFTKRWESGTRIETTTTGGNDDLPF
tara:strand:- start:17172 stop:17816 length:645 start_codon:yes stop_codon:yes gene_type:complete